MSIVSKQTVLMAVAIVGLLTMPAIRTLAVELHVNRFTGNLKIVNPAGDPAQNVDGYTVNTNPLIPPLENVIVPANWNSLTDQLEPGWEEVVLAGQEQKQISELNLTGSKTFAPGAEVSLGNAYDLSQTDESILNFQYKVAGESTATNGSVIFEGGIHLRVNKNSGVVEIINDEVVSIDFDSYVIESPTSLLEPVALIGIPETGWEVASPTDTAISELNLSTSSILAPGEKFDLGAIYTGGVTGDENLTFTFRETGVRILPGDVEYVTGIPGDFNNDEQVDGADLAQWQGDYGINGDSDGDNDGDSDGADFLIWQRNYGTGVPVVAATQAVPEPGAVALAGLALVLMSMPRNRRCLRNAC